MARPPGPERLPKERLGIEILGVEIGYERPIDLGRPFMARFGDVAEIEADGRDLRVTLKSGTVFHLDRFAADDFADGVRMWDGRHGVVELDERRIRTSSSSPPPGGPPLLPGCTARCARGRATSPAFSSASKRSSPASGRTDAGPSRAR